jgi:K+-sensing histidine kinase KdpD
MSLPPCAACRVAFFSSLVVVFTGAAGVFVTRMLQAMARRRTARVRDSLLDDLEHDLRGPLTVIRGEVELVLSQPDASPEERQRSRASVIDHVVEMERLLARRGSVGAD